MQFRVASFRAGDRVFDAEARRDIESVLSSIHPDDVRKHQGDSGRVGVQDAMNKLIAQRLTRSDSPWRSQVPVFPKDEEMRKGVWTMDFARPVDDRNQVGLEVTFNHSEALAWTLVRLALAHEAENVLPGARIMSGAVIIPTDSFKRFRNPQGKIEYRVDSAVGTYERLFTMLPKLRYYVHVPLLVFGVEWSGTGQVGGMEQVDLHTSLASVRASQIGDAEDASPIPPRKGSRGRQKRII